MYKLTQLDGFDFYSETINYRDAIGSTIRITDYDPPSVGPCGKGLHASKSPLNCFIGAGMPCAAFRVEGKQLIAEDEKISRYQFLKVIEEIFDLNSLFGFNYMEAINPINPLEIDSPQINENHLKLIKKWDSVQILAWGSNKNSLRDSLNESVWNMVLYPVWFSVLNPTWDLIRNLLLDSYGLEQIINRKLICKSIWVLNQAYIGSLFPGITNWKHIKHSPGKYPFQAAIDLIKMGFIPIIGKDKYFLFGGRSPKILWEGPRKIEK